MNRSRRFLFLPVVLSAAAPVLAENVAVMDPVLAITAGSTITLLTVNGLAADQLRRLRDEEYGVRRQALEDAFFQLLTAKEAESRGVSTPELLKREVDDKLSVPAEKDKKEFYEQNKSRVGDKSYEEMAPVIGEYLGKQAASIRRSVFLRGLKAKYGLRLFLEPPRVSVDLAGGPSKGPQDAPITLVIFSDFQCPFCSKSVDVVKRLEKLYGKSLRTVFRHYPLAAHKDAPRAAEAADCAKDQGKFWAYHDQLFAHQDKLSDDGLKGLAAAAGLNKKAFAACLDAGKHAEDWKKDAADGQSYGVTGTPTFFVNGRLLFGNQPFEALLQALDDELLLKKLPLPGAEKISSAKAGKK